MNRRKLLKMVAFAGVGTVMTGVPGGYTEDSVTAYYLVTGRPASDGARLQQLARLHTGASLHASTLPIQPAAQDVSAIRAGRLLDPVAEEDALPWLAAFARELRTRPQTGHAMLTLEPKALRREEEVTFEYDGVVYDRIPLKKTYRLIEMPGARGPTLFRLEEGTLSVVASSCRHELCKKMGTRSTGKLICAPNKLVATLPGSYGLLDAVTG